MEVMDGSIPTRASILEALDEHADELQRLGAKSQRCALPSWPLAQADRFTPGRKNGRDSAGTLAGRARKRGSRPVAAAEPLGSTRGSRCEPGGRVAHPETYGPPTE